jgi:hypothetical protein
MAQPAHQREVTERDSISGRFDEGFHSLVTLVKNTFT